jgi:hypothetical protein
VFVVAGQSNAANHGGERQSTRTGRVTAFDGERWWLASDPQPGASGNGGSFMSPFGDALVERLGVPVGLVPAAVGATSVREWLPGGTPIANLPTLTGRVVSVAPGRWESDGALFDNLVTRTRSLGPRGVRAVLLHQGESDANQALTDRTLRGELYREYLSLLIREHRGRCGWEVPWFVARASYHTPDDPGSPDIRDAQSAVSASGLSLEGPDTDALTGPLRDNSGRGVHLSGDGLRAHGKLWADSVGGWLEKHYEGVPGAK